MGIDKIEGIEGIEGIEEIENLAAHFTFYISVPLHKEPTVFQTKQSLSVWVSHF